MTMLLVFPSMDFVELSNQPLLLLLCKCEIVRQFYRHLRVARIIFIFGFDHETRKYSRDFPANEILQRSLSQIGILQI